MSRCEGKVVFITGAGRGQGRSHAVALAAEGADVALLDLGASGAGQHPPMHGDIRGPRGDQAPRGGTGAPGAELRGRRARFRNALARAADETATALGGIDYVVANAGITDGFFTVEELPLEHWDTMIDVNLTGGMKPIGGLCRYVAAKIGVRSLAQSALGRDRGTARPFRHRRSARRHDHQRR